MSVYSIAYFFGHSNIIANGLAMMGTGQTVCDSNGRVDALALLSANHLAKTVGFLFLSNAKNEYYAEA
ncbi:hypothetical protein [Zobellia uliginosa]|uniref:hypothetical protein n=1 Tax=Zobellia uliginosa TaxID=143224 RepID=UPI0026E320DD|nr:hypothetical protein [Zobellia uliginosa]MDO6518563.1 hypothetical protein [Zobellia uliginosa]